MLLFVFITSYPFRNVPLIFASSVQFATKFTTRNLAATHSETGTRHEIVRSAIFLALPRKRGPRPGLPVAIDASDERTTRSLVERLKEKKKKKKRERGFGASASSEKRSACVACGRSSLRLRSDSL